MGHRKPIAPCWAILPSMEDDMAYITKEKSAAIRKALKAAFPGWKFSVRIEHHQRLDVTILEAPIDLLACQVESRYTTDLDRTKYTGVNHYHLDNQWLPPARDDLRQIIDICNDGNHDNSDAQSDYFDVGWYFDLQIGCWDKPFVWTEQKQAA